jgi:hypothetical protein
VKICKTCKVEKNLSEFYIRNLACKKCCNQKAREWSKNNPEAVKQSSRKTKLKQKYGISVDDYNEMFKEQKGVCFICAKEHQRRPLNVDHCHKTGTVRKLLCDKCNMALGLVEDSTERLNKLMEYLNAYSAS